MELAVLRMRTTTLFAAIGRMGLVARSMDIVETIRLTAVLAVRVDPVSPKVPPAFPPVPQAVPRAPPLRLLPLLRQ